MIKETSIFDEFTGKYQLSKTLRFELKPVENTQKMLNEECIFESDGIRRKKYEETKPWINRLHREFIKDALSSFRFKNLKSYHRVFEEWQKDKKSKPAKDVLRKEENKLRGEIVSQFDATARKWAEQYANLKLKKVDVGTLFEAGIFQVLKERYENEDGTIITTENGEKVNIFDDWSGWTGYFKKFFQTRRNFYSDGDESTAIAYRIVNQNLRRFIQNIQFFEEAKQKIDVVKIEKDLGISCEKTFSLENYNNCLLQDDIDEYNRVIGGYIGKNDEKIPGINQAINEYRQENKSDKIDFLVMLDKQIHSEKEKFLDAIENDEELIKHLGFFANAADAKLGIFRKLITDFALNSNGNKYDLNKIYISSDAFERNAGRWFANYAVFERALIDTAKKYKDAYNTLDQKPPHEKDGQIKYPDFFICKHIKTALDEINERIFKDKYYDEIFGIKNLSLFEQFLRIIQYEIEQQFLTRDASGNPTEVGYDKYRKRVALIPDSSNFKIGKKEKIAIKNFAVSALAIYQMAKYFAVEKKRRWLDYFELDAQFYNAADKGYMLFYSDTEEFKSAYDEIVKGYNALRNYLTKKPYSTDKWVLNFDIQTLADGWDKNKEKENGAIILRKDDRYYLGIMHYDHKDIFTEKYKKESKGKGYEKMEYKYFPEASKMIPKCSTQLNNVRKHFNNSNSDYTLFKKKDFITKVVISRRVYDLNNIYYRKDNIASAFIPENKAEKKEGVKQFQKEYLDISKDKKRYRAALKDWIIFCIDFLKAYKNTSIFDFFKLKQPQEYKSLDEFYNDINALTYSHIFIPVSEEYLQKKNLDGELFIFEIHNKDWNLKNGKTKKGAKNLHTLYWEQLFSEENKRQNFVFKLNGGAELFFRPKTDGKKLCYKIKHNGNWIKIIKEDEKYFYVENKDKNKEEPVKVDKKEVKVVADRKRYAENTILFHCPITLNRVSENKTGAQMNADIRKAISDNEKVRIIGIDRGEKHLVYYSVIDQSEKIIEDGSLNVIGEANDKSVPYAKILEQRAKEREAARREWQEVEQIKDTKRGYVSQVVRKIADLAIQHNAIIVLEDLSFRFKQVRGGIEKSIYQQFEKQLIDKLSFLANKKETNAAKPGYPLNAYQLASPITAFKDMGKQTGIIFYTAAGYTSRTCPVCGFRRNVRFHFENIDKAREVIKNLNKFAYDARNNCFTITYSLNNFLSKEQQKESKAKNKLYEDRKRKDSFTLTTKNTIRYKWFQNESPRLRAIKNDEGVRNYEGVDKQQTKRGIVKEFDITKYFKGLLENAGILLQMNDLRVAISSYKDEKEKEKKFYEKLLFTLFLLTETRQNISNTEIDYIHCPECGFNSDKQKFQGRNFNGDANGAYNIARKGILILKKIKQFKKKNKDVVKMGWGDLSVSIDEWDKFVQK